MKFFTTGLLFFLFLQLNGQDQCSKTISYGIEIPYYKKYYKSGIQTRSSDSTTIPEEIWKKINYQINKFSNGLLPRRLRFKRAYFAKVTAELYERENPVINDSARLVYVKYRIIYELAMNNSIKILFGIDVDDSGNLMYKNELPLLFENKIPVIIPCSAALNKATALKKEIKSFSDGSLYYNPLTLKFEWSFLEETKINADYKYMIIFDAVTGQSARIEKLEMIIPERVIEDLKEGEQNQ
jgi:hypothetical protein